MNNLINAALGLAIVGVAASTSPASADFREFLGDWSQQGAQCAVNGNTLDSMFTIGPDSVQYHERRCDFAGPPQPTGVGKSYVVPMKCTGEGQTWFDTLIYALNEDGKLMVYFQNTYGYIAERCP